MVLLNIGLLIFVLFLLIILWFVWPPDSPWSPWWTVGARESREILRLAKVTKKDKVYELGSGDGRFIIIAAREFGAHGIGIEIDYIRHLTARLKVRLYNLRDKVTLIRGDFFDYNISDATVVFVYLVPRVLEKLKPKLFRELAKNTKITSYRYKFEIREKDRMRFVRSDPKNQSHLYEII